MAVLWEEATWTKGRFARCLLDLAAPNTRPAASETRIFTNNDEGEDDYKALIMHYESVPSIGNVTVFNRIRRQ